MKRVGLSDTPNEYCVLAHHLLLSRRFPEEQPGTLTTHSNYFLCGDNCFSVCNEDLCLGYSLFFGPLQETGIPAMHLVTHSIESGRGKCPYSPHEPFTGLVIGKRTGNLGGGGEVGKSSQHQDVKSQYTASFGFSSCF